MKTLRVGMHNHWAGCIRKVFETSLGSDYSEWPLEVDWLIYDWAEKLSNIEVSGPILKDGQAFVNVKIEPLATLDEIQAKMKSYGVKTTDDNLL